MAKKVIETAFKQIRKPEWLRKTFSFSQITSVKTVLRKRGLNTVCESARCPNIGECFGKNTATLMILGDTCTRMCAFCAVKNGRPLPPDPEEPERAAKMVKELGLRHAVITSVTRDDLPDGGAEQFAKTARAVRKENQGIVIELLIPDFGGSLYALKTVLDERPDILNHNVETVPSLYSKIRPQADFKHSLALLRRAAQFNITAKSGIMVGFGESEEELFETMEKLHDCGVKIVTVGQYLAPSLKHTPVKRYYEEEWFTRFAETVRGIGIPKVFAGPFVRSSYMADKVAAS